MCVRVHRKCVTRVGAACSTSLRDTKTPRSESGLKSEDSFLLGYIQLKFDDCSETDRHRTVCFHPSLDFSGTLD